MSSKHPHFIVGRARCHHTGSHIESCVYDVKWSINPHMKVGRVNKGSAQLQHLNLLNFARARGAHVSEIPFVHNCFDSVFVKDIAVILKRQNKLTAFLATYRHLERKREIKARIQHLSHLGVKKLIQGKAFLEGGDVAVLPSQKKAFIGYGFRTQLQAAAEFAKAMEIEVVPLQLIDPLFYHLDTALFVTSDGVAFAYEGAFSKMSWNVLRKSKHFSRIVNVPRADALNFALNCIEIGNTVVSGGQSQVMSHELKKMGKFHTVADMSEFILGGGSVSCLMAPIYELH